MTLPRNRSDREYQAFIECDGVPAKRTKICQETGETIKVDVVNDLESLTIPKIYNLTSPVAPNTEFSQLLSTGTKKITIRAEDATTIQFSFAVGESGTDYITIPNGCSWTEGGLNLTAVTIYMQVDSISQSIQILEWT